MKEALRMVHQMLWQRVRGRAIGLGARVSAAARVLRGDPAIVAQKIYVSGSLSVGGKAYVNDVEIKVQKDDTFILRMVGGDLFLANSILRGNGRCVGLQFDKDGGVGWPPPEATVTATPREVVIMPDGSREVAYDVKVDKKGNAN